MQDKYSSCKPAVPLFWIDFEIWVEIVFWKKKENIFYFTGVQIYNIHGFFSACVGIRRNIDSKWTGKSWMNSLWDWRLQKEHAVLIYSLLAFQSKRLCSPQQYPFEIIRLWSSKVFKHWSHEPTTRLKLL